MSRGAKAGRRLSEETRRKMGESRKGHVVTENTRAAISKKHTGRVLPLEHVESLRRAWRRRKENPPEPTALIAQQRAAKEKRDAGIVSLLLGGMTQKEICAKLGLRQQLVSRACRGAGIRVYSESKDHAKVLAAKKRYRNKHKAQVRQQHKRWREANRDHVIAKSREWASNNRQKRRAIGAAHTAKRRVIERSVSESDAKAISAFFVWLKTVPEVACRWCGRSVPVSERQADHVIPLSKGGAHSAQNLCCACAECNRRKSARMPEDWVKEMSRC